VEVWPQMAANASAQHLGTCVCVCVHQWGEEQQVRCTRCGATWAACGVEFAPHWHHTRRIPVTVAEVDGAPLFQQHFDHRVMRTLGGGGGGADATHEAPRSTSESHQVHANATMLQQDREARLTSGAEFTHLACQHQCGGSSSVLCVK